MLVWHLGARALPDWRKHDLLVDASRRGVKIAAVRTGREVTMFRLLTGIGWFVMLPIFLVSHVFQSLFGNRRLGSTAWDAGTVLQACIAFHKPQAGDRPEVKVRLTGDSDYAPELLLWLAVRVIQDANALRSRSLTPLGMGAPEYIDLLDARATKRPSQWSASWAPYLRMMRATHAPSGPMAYQIVVNLVAGQRRNARWLCMVHLEGPVPDVALVVAPWILWDHLSAVLEADLLDEIDLYVHSLENKSNFPVGHVMAALWVNRVFDAYLASSEARAGASRQSDSPAPYPEGHRAPSHGAAVAATELAEAMRIDDVLSMAAAYRADQLAVSYLVPGERDPARRWVTYPECKFCKEPTSKTGNIANMLLSGIGDPGAFHDRFGMACSPHAQRMTAELAPDLGNSIQGLRQTIERAHVEMRKHAEIYDVDHQFETDATTLLDQQRRERAEVLGRYGLAN